MNKYWKISFVLAFAGILLTLPIQHVQSLTFPLADGPADCWQVINGVPVSQGSMPEIDILILERSSDLQIYLELAGAPVIDGSHVYFVLILWDPPNPFQNATYCIAGGYSGTTTNGSYTILFNSAGFPVFTEDNTGIFDPIGVGIIWVVNQSLIQMPNNPYEVTVWTQKEVSATEVWVDSMPDDYWGYSSPPPTTPTTPTTTPTTPTTTPTTPTTTPTTPTTTPTSSGPGFTIGLITVGLVIATVVLIVRRKRK